MTEIHYVGYASQPYIRLFCTDEEHYVWTTERDLPEGVYCIVEEGKEILYTFDREKADCVKCKEKLSVP